MLKGGQEKLPKVVDYEEKKARDNREGKNSIYKTWVP